MPEQLAILPVAHAGHWLAWVLYGLPVVAVVVAIWISSRRAPEEASGDDAADEERR